MTPLTSPKTLWYMVTVFFAAALTLFFLTAGQDLPLLPQALKQMSAQKWTGDIRETLHHTETLLIQEEKTIRYRIAENLEKAGENLADPDPAPAPAPAPPVKQPTVSRKKIPLLPDHGGVSTLLRHEFRRDATGLHLLFTADQPFPAPGIFFMENPARWVLDLPGNWRSETLLSTGLEDPDIQRMVLGIHENFLRIVLHLRTETQSLPKKEPRILLSERRMELVVEDPAVSSGSVPSTPEAP